MSKHIIDQIAHKIKKMIIYHDSQFGYKSDHILNSGIIPSQNVKRDTSLPKSGLNKKNIKFLKGLGFKVKE